MYIELQSNKLYVLSGIMGAGKSTFVSRLLALGIPESCIVSADKIRTIMGGNTVFHDGFRQRKQPRRSNEDFIFDMVRNIVQNRMEQRLTTFVDATALSDRQRESLISLANAEKMPSEVIIFPVPEHVLLMRNEEREFKVPVESIKSAIKSFEPTSKFAHTIIPHDEDYSISFSFSNAIEPTQALDFISDVHSMYEPLVELVTKLGYELNEEGMLVHPEGRKLMFMGDILDRGPQPIETFEFVYNAVAKSGHYMVKGNHEEKLLRFLKLASNRRLNGFNSVAVVETGTKVMQQPPRFQQKLVEFFTQLPSSYFVGHAELSMFIPNDMSRILYVIMHADSNFKYDLFETTKDECLYGKKMNDTQDTDAAWSVMNDFPLVRGHIMPTGENPDVFVVYDNGEYGGNLMAIRTEPIELEGWRRDVQVPSREQIVKVATNFDYNVIRNSKDPLYYEMERLVKEKLVMKNTDSRFGFTLFTYTPEVHYRQLWMTDPKLLEARGIVFDLQGQIVQRPFHKVFNHGEYDQGVYEQHRQVQIVEKFNGYAFFVSKHPIEQNSLLATTTGAVGGKYADMALQFAKNTRCYGNMLEMAKEIYPATLAFEVIHPDDPHIVEYSEDQHGFVLIGARRFDGTTYTEEELDTLAAKQGDWCKRPKHEIVTVAELEAKLDGMVNHEGYMVRDPATEHADYLEKRKTKWYLVSKFIGRLRDGKLKLLFANPKLFKADIDEEYYKLVDMLTAQFTYDSFTALDETQRVRVIGDMLKTYA